VLALSAAGGFDLGPRRARRRPGLTPMIDVVFLLLVFFMLAARFGLEGGLPLALAAPGPGAWSGPPRLVDVRPDGLRLNGVAVAPDALPAALHALGAAEPEALVLIRARDGASLQHLVTAITGLEAAGMTRLAVVE
jgi:biopolymer transport protein ExbD